MAQVTFIIGGPGSGKTEEVVSRLARGYKDGRFWDVLLLAPTVRHGDQLRRRLVAKCGVAMGLGVESLSQFSRRLTASRAGQPRVAARSVADELLVRVIRREVESGGASYFRPILRTRGLGRLVRAAVLNLVSERANARDFQVAARSSGLQALEALAAIYSDYVEELNRRGWIHPAAEPLEAAQVVMEGARLPRLIVVDGFQLFRGAELALLQAVGKRTPLLVSMDPEAGDRAGYDLQRLRHMFPQTEVLRVGDSKSAPSLRVLGGESGDQEAQLRDIARLIKQRLKKEPELRPSDFAIAFRQVVPHLALARQVFAEYELPLDPVAGEPLRDQPLGAWLRRLLHLGRDGWRLADATSVLDSGFMNLGRWKLTKEDVRTFARKAGAMNSWRGYPALLRSVEALEDERVQEGMRRGLDELRTLLEHPAGSLGDWALRWNAALFDEEPLIDPECVKRRDVAVGVDNIRGHLDELVRLQHALGGGDASFESFANWLEARMEGPTLLMREVGGVVLAPIRSLSGLRFDSVFVGGLVEGEFPAPRVTTALLNDKALEALANSGLALPPEPGLSEDELWTSASSRADSTLYLWKTRIDGRGRPASGSYYYDLLKPEAIEPPQTSPLTAASRRELAIACSAEWRSGGRLRPEGDEVWPVVRESVRVEQLRRSFLHAGKYEGLVAAGLVPQLTGPDAVWSASRMESYRTCAFQFFGRYGLGLQELEEELGAADAAIRGSVIHEVLERVLAPLQKDNRALDIDTLDGVLETLRQEGPKIWNNAPFEWGFSSVQTWAFEWEDTLKKLERMLTKEADLNKKLGVDRVLGVEEYMEGELPLNPPMKVRAAIDRLDAGPDGLVVVDYKTGREIKKKRVLEADKLQLQLYAHLAIGDTGFKQVVTRYAWLNPRIKDWWLDSSNEADNEVIQEVVQVAEKVRQSVEGGDFRVNPHQQPCPTYCAFRHACRVNEFSRWKWAQ